MLLQLPHLLGFKSDIKKLCLCLFMILFLHLEQLLLLYVKYFLDRKKPDRYGIDIRLCYGVFKLLSHFSLRLP